MSKSYVISATIVTEEPNLVPTVMEAFGRVAAGLAMDDLRVSISVGTVEESDD